MPKIEGRKLAMSQRFNEAGEVSPVTAVSLLEMPADLSVGTAVKVTGTGKGKGFAGVMKRHHFKGMPGTHGRSTKGRAPGSIGGTTTPGRVYKGKRMAGRMGGERVTVWGLTVVEIDPAQKIAYLSGSLPGPRRAKLLISYEPQAAPVEPASPVPTEGESKAPSEGEQK